VPIAMVNVAIGCPLEVGGQTGIGKAPESADPRWSPRFKLEVNIQVYPRGRAVVRGSSVDISETGISAVLKDEIVLGEVVRLEFTLSTGPVEAFAVARQRTAFRYGFQFVETHSAPDAIGRACAVLAAEQGAAPLRLP
jgi:hypothetical protein